MDKKWSFSVHKSYWSVRLYTMHGGIMYHKSKFLYYPIYLAFIDNDQNMIFNSANQIIDIHRNYRANI